MGKSSSTSPSHKVVVTSHVTRTFRELLDGLPADIQELARQKFLLFMQDPHAPALSRKKLEAHPPYEAVRVNYRYRAVFRRGNRPKDNDHTYVWLWIGSRENFTNEYPT